MDVNYHKDINCFDILLLNSFKNFQNLVNSPIENIGNNIKKNILFLGFKKKCLNK